MAQFHEELPLGDSDHATLWRYLTFPHFASLLASSELFLGRADTFEDRFEGSVSAETFADHLNSLEWHFKLAAKYRLHKLPRKPEEERQLILEWFKEGPRSTYLSCWHAGSSECDGMWKSYGETREAVAIKTTVGRLLLALPGDIFIIPVQYVAPSNIRFPSGDRIWPFVFKRPEYAYESEIRCIKFDSSDSRPSDGHRLTIDLSSVLEEVVVSPRAPEWFTRTVQQLVRRFDIPVAVRRSSMFGRPWQF